MAFNLPAVPRGVMAARPDPARSTTQTAKTQGFTLQFGKPKNFAGRRVVLYAEGGVGKTTLCSNISGRVVFFDLDKSLAQLPDLQDAINAGRIQSVQGVVTWEDLRAALNAPGWDGVDTIVIDTLTVAEQMATDYVLRTVKRERGMDATSIEDYGYGKGYRYVADAFDLLLSDIERHTDAGRNVVLVCHSVIQNNTDPVDENYPRYEPRLLHTASGKVSIRLRVREWADDVLYLAKDRAVKDGKAVTGEGRTIYPTDMGWCMGKSRRFREPIVLTDPAGIWAALLNKNN